MEVYERSATLRDSLAMEESVVATQLVRGHKLVEVPGRSSPWVLDPSPEALTLPEPRPMADYITTPCRHESSIIRQVRHAKQECRALKAHNQVK